VIDNFSDGNLEGDQDDFDDIEEDDHFLG